MSKPTGKPKGRPSKYKPEYCGLVIEHMKKGGSKLSFASLVGVDETTIYEWIDRHADFSQSIKIGEAHLRLWFENLFKRMASGQLVRVKKEVLGKDGKPKIREYAATKGDATAAIFMSKNMIDWRDKKDIQLTGKDGGPIAYQDMTPEQIKKMIREDLAILGVEFDE